MIVLDQFEQADEEKEDEWDGEEENIHHRGVVRSPGSRPLKIIVVRGGLPVRCERVQLMDKSFQASCERES